MKACRQSSIFKTWSGRRCRVIAPVALFARFDPRTLNSLIMMRDMQDEMDFCRLDTDLSCAHAQSQMRLFATLHARYYQSAELETTLAPFIGCTGALLSASLWATEVHRGVTGYGG